MNKNIRVLVIGGAGYIGSILCEFLDKEKNIEKIVIVDNLSEGSKESVYKNHKFYKTDLLNIRKIVRIMKKEKINFVFHLAYKLNKNNYNKNPIEYFENIIGNNISILKAMRYSQVRNIITSFPINQFLNKNDIKNKNDIANFSSEQLFILAKESYDINYGIIKYINVSGATEKNGLKKEFDSSLIAHINNSIIFNKKISIYEKNSNTKDGSFIRNYIHVIDLVRTYIELMNDIFYKDECFNLNICSEKNYSTLEVIDEIKKSLNIQFEYNLLDKKDDKIDSLVFDNKENNIKNLKSELSISDMIISDNIFRKKILNK